MRGSRFYFADAAVDGYLQSLVENKDLGDFTNSLAKTTSDLNQTIMQIVDRFVQKRGYAYKEYNGQST